MDNMWVCESCKSLNRASDPHCYKCREPRPPSGVEPAATPATSGPPQVSAPPPARGGATGGRVFRASSRGTCTYSRSIFLAPSGRRLASGTGFRPAGLWRLVGPPGCVPDNLLLCVRCQDRRQGGDLPEMRRSPACSGIDVEPGSASGRSHRHWLFNRRDCVWGDRPVVLPDCLRPSWLSPRRNRVHAP